MASYDPLVETWLSLPFVPVPMLLELAVLAEHVGFDGVAIPDHVCVPARLDTEYPYTGSPAVLPVDTEFPDPMVLVAALGARTARLRFMTHILLVPLRHPVLLAKGVATADALTGGRVDLGVGVGWMREEFAALGVPFERRGSRMDEALPLLRRLWTGEPVAHHGEHFSFDALAVRPAPARHVPILVGGHSPAALRRAARLGDGWVGVNPPLEQLEEVLASLREERRSAGTEDRPFVIRTGLKGRLEATRVRRLAEAGVDAFIVMPWQVVPKGTAPADVSPAAYEAALTGVLAELDAAAA